MVSSSRGTCRRDGADGVPDRGHTRLSVIKTVNRAKLTNNASFPFVVSGHI
jgi:hypothetical protein